MDSLLFFKAIIPLMTKFFIIIIPVFIILRVLTGAVLRAVLGAALLFLTVLSVPGVLIAGAAMQTIIIVSMKVTFIPRGTTP